MLYQNPNFNTETLSVSETTQNCGLLACLLLFYSETYLLSIFPVRVWERG